jgi:hypothetical protein
MDSRYSVSQWTPAASRQAQLEDTSARSSRRRRFVTAGLVMLLIVAAASGIWFFRARSRLSAVKQLQGELFSQAGRELPADERRQKFEQLRTEMNQLSAAQRRDLRNEAMKRRTEEISRYFRLSKEDKQRYLDDMIARGERRRQEWEARAAQRNGSSAETATAEGGPRQRGQGNSGTAAERDKRREDMLDSMSPTQRAEFTEFRREVASRRAELGLPAFGRGRN